MMGLDAGKVLKRSVWCRHCKADFLFTLRDIADNSELPCHGCGGRIFMHDSRHQMLVNDVRDTLHNSDACQSAASFIGT